MEVGGGGLWLSKLVGSVRHFNLCRLVGVHVDDRLVAVLNVILGQLTAIDHRALGQVVFPELGLQKQVAGVGVVAQNTLHRTLVFTV